MHRSLSYSEMVKVSLMSRFVTNKSNTYNRPDKMLDSCRWSALAARLRRRRAKD